MHGLDAANRAELGVLGGDPLCGEPRRAQTDLVAEEIRQERRLSGDELREAAGVRLGDVDARFDRVAEGHERRGAAQIGRFGAQTCALGLRGVRDHIDAGDGLVQVAERHRGIRHCVIRRPCLHVATHLTH